MSALFRILLGVLTAVAATHGLAQNAAANYPNKPIRWIIDFPPAGVSDILTRTVGQKLTEYLGQGFVYDNRPGANGVIANALVAKAPSDGYTLGFISQPLSLQLTLAPNLGFSLKDFAPVALIAEYPSLLVVQAKTPVESAKEFTAWAKKKSPSISYASSGAGGAQHVAQRIIDTLAAPMRLGSQSRRLGVSIGIAVFPDDAEESDDLIRMADAAMYRAKQQDPIRIAWHRSP